MLYNPVKQLLLSGKNEILVATNKEYANNLKV